MKFTTLLSISALVATTCAAPAASGTSASSSEVIQDPVGSARPSPYPSSHLFTPVASSEDGKFNKTKIKKVDSHPHVFSVGGDEGVDVSLYLYPNTTMSDQDKVGIYVNPDTGEFGNVDPFGSQEPSKYFSIFESTGLALNKNSDWKACPSGEDKYSFSHNDCEGGTTIKVEYIDLHYIYSEKK